MASWQDVGVENFRTAVELVEGKRYRSAVSRFYYAIFALLTFELLIRSARADFSHNRETPGHGQMSLLVDKYLTQFSDERRANLSTAVRALYRYRLQADYSLVRMDREITRESHRLADNVFRYLGVNHERK